MVDGLQQVTAYAKEILRQSMYRKQSLRLSRGCELSHGTFPLSRGLVRDFCPVIRVAVGVVNHRGHSRAVCGGIAPQLLCHHPPGLASLTVQEATEEAFRCALISMGLDQDINDISILINSSPKILPLPLNGYEQFV